MSYFWIPPPSILRYTSESSDNTSEDDHDENVSPDDSSIVIANTDSEEFSDHFVNSDEEEEDILDTIYYDDRDVLESPKTHGSYYLGSVCKSIMLDLAISPRVFYKYEYKYIREYMSLYSVNQYRRPQLHIIVLDIRNDTYYAVIKTMWLRLVQRHWKKVYAHRQQIRTMRKSWTNQRYFELYGKYTYGANSMPSIYGMMSDYSKSLS